MPRTVDKALYRLGNDVFALNLIFIMMAKNRKILICLISWPILISLTGTIHTGRTNSKNICN